MSVAIVRVALKVDGEPENLFRGDEPAELTWGPEGTRHAGGHVVGIETYNGWTNRETWAVHLWLSNDHSLYDTVRELLVETYSAHPDVPQRAAEAVKSFVEDLLAEGELDQDTERAMTSDIGSLWRVDWMSVAAAFAPEGGD